MLGAAAIDTPMKQGLQLFDKSDLLKDPGHYRRLVGRLIYLTISRPDIAYSVHVLSKFMHQPCKFHMESTLHVVRYLRTHLGKNCSSPQTVISGCEPIVIQIGQDVQSLEGQPQVTVSSLAPH